MASTPAGTGSVRRRTRASSGRGGAPGPAPLAALSAPSISVSPILVPSTGGEVRLTARAGPAGVAAAVAGLSETASVERWEGDGWEAVATVDLGSPPRVGDLAGTTDRVAQIPPLEPGDYRIVRSGPGGVTLPGPFWVVSPDDLAPVGASDNAGSDADIGPALALGTPWDLPDEGVAVEVDGQIVFVGLDGTVLGHVTGTFWETPTFGALRSTFTNLLPVAPPQVGRLWLDPSTGSEQDQAVMGAPLWQGMRVLYFADEGSMLLLDGTDTTGTVASWPQDAPWWLSSDHRVVTYATCAQPGCPHRFYDSDMRGGGDLPGDCWVADNLGDFAQTRICDGGRSIVLVGLDRPDAGSPEGRSISVPDGTDGEPQTATAVFGFGDVVRLDSASCEVSETARVAPRDGGRELTPLFAHGQIGTPSNLPLGIAADGRLLVHLNAAACDATASEPGVYLVDPDSGEQSLVWAGSLLAGRARMWSPTAVDLLGGSPLRP